METHHLFLHQQEMNSQRGKWEIEKQRAEELRLASQQEEER